MSIYDIDVDKHAFLFLRKFIFNMVVAAAIGFGLVGESNEFVSAK